MDRDELYRRECDHVRMAFTARSAPYRVHDRTSPRGGLLLCHGFTGSPQSLRPWAEDHAARGWAVELPLLPGHARTWQEMARTDWTDWYGHLREAALELSERYGPIAIGGLSMGGALTLALGEDPRLRGRIAALVAVNPGMTLPPVARFGHLLSRVRPTMAGIADDVAKEGVHEEAYDRIPLRSVGELHRLFSRTRRHLDRVQAPLLLATSAVDHTVPPTDSDIVAAGVSGPLERLALPDSYHLAPLDHDAERLFAASARFLDTHVPAPEAV